MSITVIDLIRHGEPEGGRKYRGWGVDDPLTARGWQQMWDAVGESAPWQQIISSPLLRCKTFAEQLSEKHNLPLSIESDLEEVGFGSWEGRTPDEIMAVNKAEYDAFYQDPVNNRPANAEDLDVFMQRVVAVYQKVVSVYKGQHVLMVAHAGVIRAILAAVLDAPVASIYKLDVGNAGLSRIRITESSEKIQLINVKQLPLS